MKLARDINLLHPGLRPKADELIRQTKAVGIDIIITQTLRTKEEQDELYAQGRTKPGNIVTNARYPQSLHCWGVAFDIAPVKDLDGDGKLDAFYDSPDWQKIGVIGERLGLVWGGRWKSFPDRPHFELPGFTWGTLLKQYGTPEKFIKSWEVDKTVADVKVIVKGKEMPGKLADGRTWVELRSLLEALKYELVWDEKERTVIVK